MACHPPHDHDGACEDCARTDEWVALYDEGGNKADHSDCPWCVAMNEYIDTTFKENPMPTDHRANAERALRAISADDDPRNLPAGLDAIGSALLAIHDLLDERLPKPRNVDPDVVARNLDAIKHELETPVGEHGECCDRITGGPTLHTLDDVAAEFGVDLSDDERTTP